MSFGIVSAERHVGYGYTEAGEDLGDGFKVASLKETSDMQTATDYVNADGFYRNSGNFCFGLATT